MSEEQQIEGLKEELRILSGQFERLQDELLEKGERMLLGDIQRRKRALSKLLSEIQRVRRKLESKMQEKLGI